MDKTTMDKTIISCALTGVLTDPGRYPVPVTPEEMAAEARRAFEAGASIMHCHFRNQSEGLGYLPTWDVDVVDEIAGAIRDACPGVILNFSTGVVGDDISGPLACLERSRPEMAALNAGSLNYLKVRKSGEWAWPPMLFDNTIEKIGAFLTSMDTLGIVPECECFDTGIVRSIAMLKATGMLRDPLHISLVMGVASGMPAKASWLPLLIDELPEGAHWQTIVIGRTEVWEVHRASAELGGHLRTGLEDTFYLPTGERATSNGELVAALAEVARAAGRTIASPSEARAFVAAQE